MGLSVLKILYCPAVIEILRKKFSNDSLFSLREKVLFLLELITDLSRLPSELFVYGTPPYRMLERAILDFLYRDCSGRESEYYMNLIFVYQLLLCRFFCTNRFQSRIIDSFVG